MATPALQAEHCPTCTSEMRFEGPQVIHFNGGRGDVPVLTYKCLGCGSTYHIAENERGLAQG